MFITILVYHSKTPDTTLLAQVGPPQKIAKLLLISNLAIFFFGGYGAWRCGVFRLSRKLAFLARLIP